MKISKDYPILMNSSAILIVSGKFSAIIYKINDGELKERDAIKIEKPDYSENKGFVEYGGYKNTIRSGGSAYEPKTQYLKKKFIKDLMLSISKLKNPYKDVYLFAPEYISADIESAMPKKVSSKIKKIYLVTSQSYTLQI